MMDRTTWDHQGISPDEHPMEISGFSRPIKAHQIPSGKVT